MSSKVYSKFTGKKSDGSILKLRIQDLSSARIEDALDLYVNNFIAEEPFEIAAGINKSKEAIEESRTMVKEMMMKPTLHTIICCLDSDSDDQQILGMSMVELSSKNASVDQFKDWEAKIKSKELQKLFELIGEMYINTSIMEKYAQDKYFDGRGVTVHSDFKDMGIVTELLKVTRLLCKEHGVPMVMAWITTLECQKGAEQAGWETVAEISSDDIATRHRVVFENAPTTIKLMIGKA